MELNEHTVRAEGYAKTKDGVVFVKVSFFGIYLNSITVKESPKFPEHGLWVQLPKFAHKGNWTRPIMPIERNVNGGLWKLIERKCREAAEGYEPGDITLSDIPSSDEFELGLDEAIKAISTSN